MKVMSLLHSLLTARQFLEDVLMVLMYKRRLAFGTLKNWAVDFSGLWLLSDPSLPFCNVILINGNWFYFCPLKIKSLAFFPMSFHRIHYKPGSCSAKQLSQISLALRATLKKFKTKCIAFL